MGLYVINITLNSGGNNVCYAYEIKAKSGKKIILYNIYGFQKTSLIWDNKNNSEKKYFLNYKNLKKEFKKLFDIGEWEDEYITHY